MIRAALGLVLAFQVVGLLAAPEQVHLSYGDTDARTIIVTWLTLNTPEAQPFVEYEPCGTPCAVSTYTNRANATETEFIDGGSLATRRYIYRAVLTNLRQLQKYSYRISSAGNLSLPQHFSTPGGSDWSPRIAVFGDLGGKMIALPALSAEAEKGNFDAVVGVGDYAYDFGTDNGTNGDIFMRTLEPFAKLVPLMLCPGNHEDLYNFSHWVNRFSMPDHEKTQNFYYSFNVGPIHFVSISTEHYFYPHLFNRDATARQYEWIKNDLTNANTEANRKERPFIVVLQHRPFYCIEEAMAPDTGLSIDCDSRATLLRDGSAALPYGLEELFYTHKVDLVIEGHVHYYERTHPIYKGKHYLPTEPGKYENPQAPIHVISGAIGNPWGLQQFLKEPNTTFTAAKNNERFSYGRMFANKTHLTLQHVGVLVATDLNPVEIDNFSIIKTGNGNARLYSSPIMVILLSIILAVIRK